MNKAKALYFNYIRKEHLDLIELLKEKDGLLFINSVSNTPVDKVPYFHSVEMLHFTGHVIATCPVSARYLCEIKTPRRRSYYLDNTMWVNQNAIDNCTIFNTLEILCPDEEISKTVRKIFNIKPITVNIKEILNV